MNKNEQLLSAALRTAITEVNFLAEGCAASDCEWSSLDLLDRLEAGIKSGDISLKVNKRMFADGRLCWPSSVTA